MPADVDPLLSITGISSLSHEVLRCARRIKVRVGYCMENADDRGRASTDIAAEVGSGTLHCGTSEHVEKRCGSGSYC